MKPDTITIPFTVTFDPAAAELAELARHIVTRLTDEGALDEAAEHGHGIMATSAAIEWARERLGNQIPAVPEPRRMIRTPQAIARDDGLVVDAGQGFE